THHELFAWNAWGGGLETWCGGLLSRHESHAADPSSMSVSPDGNMVRLTLSRGAPSLVVGDVSTGTMRPTPQIPGDGVCVIGASSDRSSLLLVTGQSALTLDAETLLIRNRMSIGGSSGALSSKCSRFVTNRVVNGAGTATLANSPDGLILATIRDLDVMP